MRAFAVCIAALLVSGIANGDELANLGEGAWSKPVNGLQGRLLVKSRGKVRGTDVLDLVLELKNTSRKPVSIRNSPNAVSLKITDAQHKPLPQVGFESVGQGSDPQWATIPRGAYLGFSLYPRAAVGVPGNAGAFVVIEHRGWTLQVGEFTLHPTLKVQNDDDGLPNAWSGTIELPEVKVTVPE